MSRQTAFQFGDHAEALKDVQRKLGVKADGQFGIETLKAVTAFQVSRRINELAECGPKTMKALGLGGKP